MKFNLDAAFLLDDNYHLEGVATAYSKLGLDCTWWEPSKKPYFDLLDECNPKVVYYSNRGAANNALYLREAETHLTLKNVCDDYPDMYVNDLLYYPGVYDKYLESDALMIIKTQLNETQIKSLLLLCSTIPRLKIISKKYIPINNSIGACDIQEIRDAIASTKCIVDYDNTFAAVAIYYGINCVALDGSNFGVDDGSKPKTFLEAVQQHVSNSSQ